MERAIGTFIFTVIVGYLGLCIFPAFGAIFSVATAGAFIVYAIERKNKE